MDDSQLVTYQVSGHSMHPLLRDGQTISAMKIGHYAVGDIVVARHPIQTDLIIVKRISALEEGAFRLEGINREENTDRFGLVPAEKILGKVTLEK